jgi:uncharacterized protein (TIGR03435 family)
MYRRVALLSLGVASLAAQSPPPPKWKEFSIGPAGRKLKSQDNNVRQGLLHSESISLRSLLEIAAGVPWPRILGPEWMDAQHYSVAAELSDASRLRLRTRSPEDTRVVDEFQSLLTQELARRFHLQFHREVRKTTESILRAAEGGTIPLKVSTARDRARLNATDSTLEASAVDYRGLGSWLQTYLKTPVTVDESLPPGDYDFRLKWSSGDQGSLLAVLKEQLGLELATETHDLEYVVVDRVERPGASPDTGATPAAPAPVRDSSVTFDAAQLRRDLRIARQALEEGHPGIYRYTPKAELDRVFDDVAARLNHPMTALQLYRVLAPAIAQIKCGHTALAPSRAIELRLADEAVLPIEAAILGGRVYVARDFSDEGIPLGAEIQAINDVPIAEILQSMLAVVHGDGDSATAGPYRLSHRRGFARQLSLIAGVQAPFRVRYSLGGQSAQSTLSGQTLKAMDGPSNDADHVSWKMLDDGVTGLLKITAFAGDAGVFDGAFQELDRRKATHLILDVRDNGGGEDEVGRRLFAYLADRPFRYYRDLILNALSFRFLQFVPDRNALPANMADLAKSGSDHKYHFTANPNWGIQQPATPHFGGKVLVLMNGGSFSTTCEFLSMLHARGGATFIGEETGGGYYGNTSGITAKVVFPNSKLVLPVPLVGYYMAIDGTQQGTHGIPPDYPVEYSMDDVLAGRDKAMEVAVRLTRAAPAVR